MIEFPFQDLSFSDMKDYVHAVFLDIFSFDLAKTDLAMIAPFTVSKNSIIFDCNEKKASKPFARLLETGFAGLKSNLDNKPSVYVHLNSGIPLIGCNSFGIIDRNTTCIEIKPITGCNLNCAYCSVDEGKTSKKQANFVVEKDYMIQELAKLVALKGKQNIEIHIGTKGEPLLYKPLPELISDISAIPQIKIISMDTNGILLDKKKVDELIKCGLTRFNISLNSLDEETACKMAGAPYPVKQIKAIIEYIASKAEVIIAPVLVPGVNDKDMPALIEFAISLEKKWGKKQHPYIGIQNFMHYLHGRKPVKQRSMDDFFSLLEKWEEQYRTSLILHGEKDFGIINAKSLAKPFAKGEFVTASLACQGAWKNERIAVAKDRCITVINCRKQSGQVRLKILRAKHNIYTSKEA